MFRDVFQSHQEERLESFDVFDEALAHDFGQRGDGHQSVFLDAAGLVGRVEHLRRERGERERVEGLEEWEEGGEWKSKREELEKDMGSRGQRV